MLKIGSIDRTILPLLFVGLLGLLGGLFLGRSDFPKVLPGPGVPGAIEAKRFHQYPPQLDRLHQEAEAAHGDFVKAFGNNTGQRSASLTIHPRATTAADALALFRRYYLRDLDLYLAHTKDQGTARDSGAAFIKAAVHASCVDLDSVPNLDELSRQAADLWNSDSTDPLLRSHTVCWLNPRENSLETATEVTQRLLTAIENLAGTPYPASVEAALRSSLYERAGALHGVDKRLCQEQMNQAIVKWLKEQTPDREWHRFVYVRLKLILPIEERKSILTMGSEQGVDPWILHTLAGEFHLQNALDARGSSYAPDVKAETWNVFERESKRAAVHLRYAWLLHPEFPITSASMITIANIGADEGRTPTDWFHKLLEAQFDYEMGYGQYMLSLLPRWGGSERQMISFARSCLATNRFETDVPDYALQTVSDLVGFERHPIKTLFKDIPATRELIDSYCRQRAQWLTEHAGKEPPYNSKSYPARVVRFYLENGFPDEAHQTALTTSDEVPYQHRWDLPRYGEYDWQKIRAASADVRLLIDRLDQGLHLDHSQVLSTVTLDRLALDLQQFEKLATTPAAKNIVRHFQVMLQQRKAFSSGDWVDLLNGPDPAGCEFYASQARYLEDLKLWELQSTPQFNRDMQVVFLAGIAPPFEIELQASVERSEYTMYGGFSAGIGWSLPLNRYRSEKWDSKQAPGHTFFGLTPQQPEKNGPKVFAIFPYRGCGIDQADTGWKGPSERLSLNLWPGSYEYRAGQFAMIGPLCEPLRQPFCTDGILTLGEMTGSGDQSIYNVSMRIGAIRIRRTKVPPPPSTAAGVLEKIAYWEQRQQVDLDDVVPKRELARLLYRSDPTRTLKLGREVLGVSPAMNGIHSAVGQALTELKQFEAAEAELEIAQKETPQDDESGFGLIENWLARPAPTQKMIDQANRFVGGLSTYNECRSLILQARLSFLQKDPQRAFDLIKRAMGSASEEQKTQLQQLLEEHQPTNQQQAK